MKLWQTDLSNSRSLKIFAVLRFLFKRLLCGSHSKKKHQWALLAYSLRKYGQTFSSSVIQSLEDIYFLGSRVVVIYFKALIKRSCICFSWGFYRLKYLTAEESQINKRIEKINAYYTDWSFRKKCTLFLPLHF